ncbi:MAG: helix-turn-helix domain-containing protein [Candidatus Caldarchaeum sp.]|nr:helix-turn-helix domain-containing protein [Candidatus Caldarchaeum sp.]MDW8436198.1 helix-turn-helix domain-containing protein [Candidatus Caldarchaeum sp.]
MKAPNHVSVVIRNSNCKVAQMLLSKDIEGSFKNIRVGEKISSHLIHLSKPVNLRDIRLPEVTYYKMGREFLWVDSPSCLACQILSRNPAIPTNLLFVRRLGVVFSFLTPGPYVSKRIFDEMKREGLEVSLLDRKFVDLRQVLTRKQRDVLCTAFSMGYFAPTRETSLAEIAARLGVSKSTVSRQLRAAVRKLTAMVRQEPA